MAGFTLGITTENIPPFSSCSSVIGLDAPGEIHTSGRKMEGVWFENHHPVYLSSTEVNGTAIATGDYPSHDGIIANRDIRAGEGDRRPADGRDAGRPQGRAAPADCAVSAGVIPRTHRSASSVAVLTR